MNAIEIALRRILVQPYGCRFCDSGKLRTPNNPAKDHDDDCGFLMAEAALRACAEAPETTDLERWRTFYQALAWMRNDYIGVCGISADFTQKDKRLGYAHEGFHNAERVRRAHKPPVPAGMQQGIRCKCWETEKGPPHTHYDEPPYRCARGCGCKAYEPAAPPRAEAPPPTDKAHDNTGDK